MRLTKFQRIYRECRRLGADREQAIKLTQIIIEAARA